MAGITPLSRWLKYLLAGVAILAILVPSVAADSITRGGTFTVSIAGKPATDYYVWLTGTSSMSGKPGDQPPVIVGGTENVEFDPDGGPYVIGSYKYYDGNGRTILEDVAPSSDTVSNTRYYAKLTTDSDGYGIIEFQTSSATADRTFTVKAENPSSPGEDVPVKLGLPPTKTPTATPSLPVTTVPLPTATTVTASPAVTTPVTLEPVTTVPTAGILTPATTQAPATSTSPKVPVDITVVIGAVSAACVLLRRTR